MMRRARTSQGPEERVQLDVVHGRPLELIAVCVHITVLRAVKLVAVVA